MLLHSSLMEIKALLCLSAWPVEFSPRFERFNHHSAKLAFIWNSEWMVHMKVDADLRYPSLYYLF